MATTRRPRAPRGEGERLRDEILAATERLLIETGDQSCVSIRAIAEAVGVTPPSIYLHFEDKDALIREVCQAQFAKLEARITRAMRGKDDPVDRLRTMGETYIDWAVKHPEEYRVLLMSKGEMSRADFERGEVAGARAFGALVRAVEACIDAGVFRKEDPFLVATALWTIVHGIASLAIAMEGFPLAGRNPLTAHLLDTYAAGLAP